MIVFLFVFYDFKSSYTLGVVNCCEPRDVRLLLKIKTILGNSTNWFCSQSASQIAVSLRSCLFLTRNKRKLSSIVDLIKIVNFLLDFKISQIYQHHATLNLIYFFYMVNWKFLTNKLSIVNLSDNYTLSLIMTFVTYYDICQLLWHLSLNWYLLTWHKIRCVTNTLSH